MSQYRERYEVAERKRLACNRTYQCNQDVALQSRSLPLPVLPNQSAEASPYLIFFAVRFRPF
jgi:hypothetical protein